MGPSTSNPIRFNAAPSAGATARPVTGDKTFFANQFVGSGSGGRPRRGGRGVLRAGLFGS